MPSTLPAMNMADNPTGCCPRFDPAPWDGKEFGFEGLRFATAKTRSFFYMPLDMAKVMTAAQKAIDGAGAASKDRCLILSKDLSPWKAEHRFLVAKDVPGMETLAIPGTWYARVFDGPFSKMGQWFQAMAADLKGKGKEPAEFQAFYTTCPKCAAAYGHNYVVLFARVA